MQPFKVEMIQDNYTTSQNIKQPQAISSKVVWAFVCLLSSFLVFMSCERTVYVNETDHS